MSDPENISNIAKPLQHTAIDCSHYQAQTLGVIDTTPSDQLSLVELSANNSPVASAVTYGGLRGLLQRRRAAKDNQQPLTPEESNEPITEQRPGIEISGEAKNFWDQGEVKVPKHFHILVDDVRSGKDDRPRILQASDSAILDDFIMRSKLHFTEAEGILDLADYLSFATEAAIIANDTEILDKLATFEKHFCFLGTKEYEAATEGLAQAWLAYLQQSPDHVLNIWTDCDKTLPTKSQTAIAHDIISKFAKLEGSEQYAAQLRVEPTKWLAGPDAKLIVADDYVATGVSMRENLARAHAEARSNNVAELLAQTEIHILIAKQDQRHITNLDDDAFVVRAYYRSKDSPNRFKMNFSGAHSSMDNGFETIFEKSAAFLRQRNIIREVPLLAYLERAYYDGHAITPAGQESLQAIITARQLAAAAHSAQERHKAIMSVHFNEYLAQLPTVEHMNDQECALWKHQIRAQELQDKRVDQAKLASITTADGLLTRAVNNYRSQKKKHPFDK